MPNLFFALVTLFLLEALRGGRATFASAFGVALLLWLLAQVVGRYHAKNPKPWMLTTGTAIYWFGAVLGLCFVGEAIYMSFYSVTTGAPERGSLGAVIQLLILACFFWFSGRAIRYMLGR
jgi:hypothetical protein